MKPRISAAVGLLLLATCTGDFADQSSTPESTAKALGTIPPTEVAVWQKVSSSNLPDGRYLQALAFDESRRVVVMFGGITYSPNTGSSAPNGETWEWDPKTGKWTNRTGTGTSPEARSGASLAYDSVNKKFVLFGGRAGSGYNLEDTWEWEPTAGAWTNVSAAGGHPSARCQQGMVYEKGSAKVLLFGGGRSDINSYDGTGILASFGDTWEYDPIDHTWKQITVTATPSPRHAFGFAWDSVHSTAVLFGGMQTDIPNAPGIPKQDTWEWNPSTATWTERTVTGSKPSQRYGQAMAFDGKGGKVLLFGGLDVSSGGSLNDLWEMDPTTHAWTRRLSGSEAGVPSGRLYASLVSDDVGGVLELVAGYSAYNQGGVGGSYGAGGMYVNYGGMYGSAGMETAGTPGSAGAYGAGGMDGYAGSTGGGGPIGPMYPTTASREVWELDPSTPKFTERSSPLDVPPSRVSHAVVYNPQSGRTVVFGGYDTLTGQPLNDLWEWDGKAWAQVAVETRPPARADAALAYDPVRKSLILFGGMDYMTGSASGETWEFGANRKWTQLKPSASPDPLYQHGMVTDTTRGKILLFGGMSNYIWDGSGNYKDPMRQDVWEWDGATITWTKRSSSAAGQAPYGGYPVLSYDEGQQKLFVLDNGNGGGTGYNSFWEWSPITTGWESRSFGDSANLGYASPIAYDSIRRRQVLLVYPNTPVTPVVQETWEVDTRRPNPTLYVRSNVPGPVSVSGAAATFDSARGVVVVFGGQDWNTGMGLADTWEYKVSNLGNGEGCTAVFASSCASGFCVEGVCCEAAACSGACKSCSVPGSEGTCVLAAPGTDVPGSCPAGSSCDATGTCKPKNGQTCTAATDCASGFCVDGVCCDSACTGNCKSCNQAGRAGQCTPYTAGTDPKGQCGLGTGACKSTCDGVGACVFPQSNVSCGDCLLCNGNGDCSMNDYNGCPYIGTGGRPYNTGGSGGYIPIGGSGGYIPTGGRGGSFGGGGAIGGSGGTPPRGGNGGGTMVIGGSGGTTTRVGTGGTTGTIADGGPPSTGGIDGGGPAPSGTGGLPSGTGGDTGTGPRLDGATSGSSDVGGSPAHDDAGTAASLGKSGCSCDLGRQAVSRSGSFTLFLALGIAIPLLRRRRRS